MCFLCFNYIQSPVVSPGFKTAMKAYFRMRLHQLERQAFALGSYAVLIAFVLITFFDLFLFLQQNQPLSFGFVVCLLWH